MVAHTNSKPKEKVSDNDSRLGPSVKRKHMSRPRKRLSCGEGRDFFRLAADFASADKHESDFDETTVRAPKEAVVDLTYSKYLQSRYQDRSPLFVAKPNVSVLPHEQLEFFSRLWAKWQQAFGQHDGAVEALFVSDVEQHAAYVPMSFDSVSIHGVTFSSRELSAIFSIAEAQVLKGYLATKSSRSCTAKLAAKDFHLALRGFIEEKALRPFLLLSHTPSEKRLLVERARLFWSHRLRTKALQIADSAEPSIFYFHAALGASTAQKSRVDFLYWLKMDDDKNIIAGDFINVSQSDAYPCQVFYAEELFYDLERFKACIAPMNPAVRLFVEMARSLLIVH